MSDELCECHKAKRPDWDFPHIAGQSAFCSAGLEIALMPLNWRNGTETMTEGENVLWDHDHFSVSVMVQQGMDIVPVFHLNREQTVNMISGLSSLLAKLNDR